jgi:hypothetical protein
VTVLGWGKCRTASILPGFGLVPLSLTTWPRNIILFVAKQHLFGFEIHFPEFAQNHIQMLKMLSLTFAVDVEVIHEQL